MVTVLCGLSAAFGTPAWLVARRFIPLDRTPCPVGHSLVWGSLHGEHGYLLGVCVHVVACQQLVQYALADRGVVVLQLL
jgi:hypothetical protein